MIENTLLEQDNRRRRWLRTSAGLAAIIAMSAATGWGVASLAAPAAAPVSYTHLTLPTKA